MISLRKVPLSGDGLVDWIFKQFIFFLRRETLRIKRKKRLLNPDDPHHAIRGLMDSDLEPKIEITINAAKSVHCNRDEEAETLIHELCHILFWKTQERFIRQAEKILIKRLTSEQMSLLKSFIPRHEVKT